MTKKWIGIGLVSLVVLLAGVFLKLSVWYVASYELQPVNLSEHYQVHIMRDEVTSRVTPGTNKTFQWRSPDRRKTPIALVQIHGFSATRREIAPIPERLAEATESNLFMTRLGGHGQGKAGMANVTAQGLLRDAEEALAVGKKMGNKVVLLGVSTGATLALDLAARHPEAIAGLILISPNFRPARKASLWLKGPIGKKIAQWYVGEHRWKPDSADEERYWTTEYSAVALHELMNLLSWLNQRDLSEVRVPAMLVSSDRDPVISLELVQERMATYGGPLKIEEFKGAHHVVIGDIKGATQNQAFLEKSIEFIQSLKTESSAENTTE